MSFARQVARNRLKREYAEFKKAWSSERGYQRYLKNTGMELPKNQRELGRCPTFRQFVESVRPLAQARQSQSTAHDSSGTTEPDEKIMELQDLAWEEQ